MEGGRRRAATPLLPPVTLPITVAKNETPVVFTVTGWRQPTAALQLHAVYRVLCHQRLHRRALPIRYVPFALLVLLLHGFSHYVRVVAFGSFGKPRLYVRSVPILVVPVRSFRQASPRYSSHTRLPV